MQKMFSPKALSYMCLNLQFYYFNRIAFWWKNTSFSYILTDDKKAEIHKWVAQSHTVYKWEFPAELDNQRVWMNATVALNEWECWKQCTSSKSYLPQSKRCFFCYLSLTSFTYMMTFILNHRWDYAALFALVTLPLSMEINWDPRYDMFIIYSCFPSALCLSLAVPRFTLHTRCPVSHKFSYLPLLFWLL